MNVNLHIERLILDGIEVPAHEQAELISAITTELTRMLSEGGLTPGSLVGKAKVYVSGETFQTAGPGNPGQLGQNIAQAVYGGIGR